MAVSLSPLLQKLRAISALYFPTASTLKPQNEEVVSVGRARKVAIGGFIQGRRILGLERRKKWG